jgi:hypothetical protein
LIFVGAEDTYLHAVDKATGKDLWHGPLPAKAYANAMTRRTSEGHQLVAIAMGCVADAALGRVHFGSSAIVAKSGRSAAITAARLANGGKKCDDAGF